MHKISEFLKAHTTGLFVLFFLVSGGYLLVTEFWYFGTAQFYISEAGTSIKIEKNGELFCEDKACAKELIPGTYKFSVEKENFETAFGEMKISLQEISELKVNLSHTKTQFSQNINFQKKKNFLHLFPENFEDTQKQVAEISGFSLDTKSLKYQNATITPLFSQKILISSDEIGRGYWIITPHKVQQFHTKTQNLKNALRISNGEISGFLALQDGSFVTEISGKFFWKNSKEPLPFSPLSINAMCKSGDAFFVLEKIAGEIAAKRYAFNGFKEESLGVIENFPEEDFESLQCIGNTKVVIFFQKHENILLERN